MSTVVDISAEGLATYFQIIFVAHQIIDSGKVVFGAKHNIDLFPGLIKYHLTLCWTANGLELKGLI